MPTVDEPTVNPAGRHRASGPTGFKRSSRTRSTRNDRPLSRAERTVAALLVALLIGYLAFLSSMSHRAETLPLVIRVLFGGRTASGVAVMAGSWLYARRVRRPPWLGPARLLQNERFRTWAMHPTAPVRVTPTWRRRMAIGLAVAGLILVVTGLSVERAEQQMVSDLRAHGVRTEGQAVRDFRKSDNEAQVRFPVRDEVQVRTLQIQDTVPQTPKQGDTLAIVYDANDPSRVLLVSQLTDQHRVFNYGAAALGGVFVIFGGLWWRRSSRPVRLPTLPSTDLRVGPDGKLPRERRRR